MAKCKLIRKINEVEYLGDSLISLNNNFFVLNRTLCNLKTRLDTKVEVRTFFYYGINAENGTNPSPIFNMQDGVASRPSNSTIQNFVNNSNQLDLLPISKRNDQVYVIYQKTGYLRKTAKRSVSGTVDVSLYINSSTIQNETRTLPWTDEINDDYNIYTPVFIIWHLTHDGTNYKVNTGFPKFLQNNTSSTINWDNPKSWATY
jgi:hypothetical protein